MFGAIGRGADPGRIHALAIINRERGTDSLGLFDSNGRVAKQAGDPRDLLGEADISGLINETDRWFIAGHTRHATRGKVKRRNAHPFKYGSYIGSHNGMVHAPDKFAVDSMYVFHLLNKHGGDYQTALENVSGYWSLTWYDGKAFYVQAHDNTLFFTKQGDVFYYSSTRNHLRAAMGNVECFGLDEGETYRFDENGQVSKLTPFESKSKGYHWYGGGDESRWYKGGTRGKVGYSTGTAATRTGSGTPADAYRYLTGQKDLFRDSELRKVGADLAGLCCDLDREEARLTAQMYEDAACDMGFMSVSDLQEGMDLGSRWEAYDYIDQYHGDRRILSY